VGTLGTQKLSTKGFLVEVKIMALEEGVVAGLGWVATFSELRGPSRVWSARNKRAREIFCPTGIGRGCYIKIASRKNAWILLKK